MKIEIFSNLRLVCLENILTKQCAHKSSKKETIILPFEPEFFAIREEKSEKKRSLGVLELSELKNSE